MEKYIQPDTDRAGWSEEMLSYYKNFTRAGLMAHLFIHPSAQLLTHSLNHSLIHSFPRHTRSTFW